MSEDVTKIINTLCEKLGVAANYLIPELAKKNIAQDVVGIILCVLALVVEIAFIRWTIKKSTDEDGDVDFDGACFCIIPGIACVITFIAFCSIAYNLAGWIASPTAMAIEKIIGMIK